MKKSSWRVMVSVCLLGLLLGTSTMSAQTTISTGSIQGVVTDPTGALVGGAKISISDKSTGRVINVKSTLRERIRRVH